MTARAAPNSAAWAQWLVIGASVRRGAYVALVPLAFLLWQSVHSYDADTAAAFFARQFHAVYAGPGTGRLVANSLRFAAGASLIAFASGRCSRG